MGELEHRSLTQQDALREGCATCRAQHQPQTLTYSHVQVTFNGQVLVEEAAVSLRKHPKPKLEDFAFTIEFKP